MLRKILFLALPLACLSHAATAQSLDERVNRELPSLLSTYVKLHAAPELSHHEEHTAAFLAGQLRALGFDVTEHIGKYRQPGLTGYGLVAIMRNGAGPVVLVRTELDALPVEEKTGLTYASKVKTKDEAGQDVSVMHACGHDVHMTTLLGTAKMLVQLKDRWRGTLILIGQPAEERIDGARAMLDDGMYTRFPRPNYAIALHDVSDLEAGLVGYTPGYALASATSVDITVRGIGGHGAHPDSTKDPIVLAAAIITELQTIVSRERSPFDPAVVTVGSIHGGTKHNIIPDDVHLQLTVRAFKEEVRQRILASIARIARGEAIAAGVPEELYPIVTVSESEAVPATYNDLALTERLAGAFRRALGNDRVVESGREMGSEDFGLFGLEGHQIPICMFRLGAVDPARVAESRKTGKPLPSLHSSLFQPLPEPTIRTGVIAMTAAVLDLMKPQ
jgi:amidohydrolase